MTDEQTPSITELLAHRPFLEQLALRLTGERESADDLVQDTWLEAIERPPRHGANLSAWLQSVARHNHYRRRDRDALLKTTELDPVLLTDDGSAEELAERSEISRQIADLTLRLEEPYRRVVLQRFYDGKVPTQIAVELARPVNTVTSQLARGLERLRAELDRQHGGRSRWSQALLPLVPGHSRVHPEAPPRRLDEEWKGSSRRVALSAGNLLTTGFVAVLLTILVSEWRPSSQDRALTTPALASEVPATDVAARPASREPLTPDPEPPSSALAGTSPSQDPGVDLEVVDTAGSPIAGARIYVTRRSAPVGVEDLATDEGGDESRVWSGDQRTDLQGRSRVHLSVENAVPLPLAGEFVGLVVEGPGFVRSSPLYLPYPLRPRETIRVPLEHASLTVRGKVIDPEGAPARALVFIGSVGGAWVYKDDMIVIAQSMGCLTDQGGNFELNGLAPCTQRILIKGEGLLSLEDWVDEASATDRVFLLQRGTKVHGVVTKDGNPVAGASICAEFTPANIAPMRRRTTSDADGAFELTGICGDLVCVSAQHPDDPLLTDSILFRITGLEELNWSPELDRRPPLRVKVVTDDGLPVSRACVRILSDLGNNWWRKVVADDDGIASIPGLGVANYLADVFLSEEDFESNLAPCVAGRTVDLGERLNTLVIPRNRLEHGTFKARVIVSPDPLVMGQIYVRPTEGRIAYPIGVDESTGTFLGVLSPQPYMAVLFLEHLGVVSLGVHEVRANETCDLGSIVVPATGTVDVDWPWREDGWQYRYKLTQLADNGGWTVPYGWVIWQGQGPFSGAFQVLPGRYEWSIWKNGTEVERQSMELESNAIVRVSTSPETDTSER